MKILCDVCDKDEASFFCVADEATLCAACDHRVHHANKLARKHHRFSLLPLPTPLCDICQEKRGFLFCQQHRAILCKDCDIPIHSANEHTQKHARFLLTGVRLSPTCTFYSPPPSSAESAVPIGIANRQDAPSPAKGTTPQCTTVEATSSNAAISASSIAEYLIEMLPGWHVEDLLDASSPSPSAFCQSAGENEMLPIWDGDFHQNMGVPQDQSFQSTDVAFGLPNGYGDQRSKELLTTNSNSIKLSSRKRSDDNSFAVPQISQSTASIKRSRNLW